MVHDSRTPDGTVRDARTSLVAPSLRTSTNDPDPKADQNPTVNPGFAEGPSLECRCPDSGDVVRGEMVGDGAQANAAIAKGSMRRPTSRAMRNSSARREPRSCGARSFRFLLCSEIKRG